MKKEKKQKLTKAEKKLRSAENKRKMKQEIKEHPVLFAAYVVLRALVIDVMVLHNFNRE